MVVARQRRDIEDLVVWALRDQGLGWAGKERPRDDISDLGTIIDDSHHGGSHPSISLWSDDDAMLVKLAIDGLIAEARALLVQYGRAAMRPDWCEEGYGSYQQLRYGKRLMWDWSDPINRTGTKTARMGFVGEQRETVDFMRAQYGLWWRGLTDIVAPLNREMERNEAVLPRAPERPWEMAKPVVFGPDGVPLEFEGVAAKVAPASLEELRALAADPICTQARDWDFPQR